MIKPGTLKIKDNSKKFEEAIRALRLESVLIGIPEAKSQRESNPGEEAGKVMTNAQIGYIQEFGSERAGIPPRPFLIPGILEAQEDLVEKLRVGIIKSFVDKTQARSSLVKAGIIGMNWVKSWITAGIGFDDLSPSTLASRKRRGFKGTKPLIESGQLRNSITYAIREK